MKKSELFSLTQLLRYDILTSTSAAGSGHPTSSLSAVELMTALWFDGHFHYDPKDPKYIFNDRMIFSKGHASPLLYSLYRAAGWIEYKELMTLRKFDSRLEGHPTTKLPWVDVATGSLGQGLSVGIGMALGIKLQLKIREAAGREEHNLPRIPHVYVLMGDSEFSEGQIYEALQLASYYKLNNLVGILDVNRLGQRGETMLGWDLKTYEDRAKSFGWNTVVAENGNNLEEVQNAFNQLKTKGQKLKADMPTMIIAKTKKGAGVSSVENKDGWHGKPLPKEMLDGAIKELGKININVRGKVHKPQILSIQLLKKEALHAARYTLQDKMATREAYGVALKLIAEDSRIVVLDAETSNSTYAETMKEAAPDRFFEMYIAEQNMVSVGLGMSKIGLIPYVSSFAAFLSRCYDQIRMCQYSDPNVKIVGSHAGVSIGEDGSSQMALEDLAMMRALLHSTVLYPSDPISTIKLVEEMRTCQGLSYLRLTRAKTETLYKPDETFPIGGSKVLVSSKQDRAVVIAAGITVHEALKAQKQLEKKGTHIAVIDAYSIKPIDKTTIVKFAKQTGHVIAVEDHYPDGGLGDAVRQTLDGMDVTFTHLAVKKIPQSGTSAELLRYEDIDAQAIVKAVMEDMIFP